MFCDSFPSVNTAHPRSPGCGLSLVFNQSGERFPRRNKYLGLVVWQLSFKSFSFRLQAKEIFPSTSNIPQLLHRNRSDDLLRIIRVSLHTFTGKVSVRPWSKVNRSKKTNGAVGAASAIGCKAETWVCRSSSNADNFAIQIVEREFQ